MTTSRKRKLVKEAFKEKSFIPYQEDWVLSKASSFSKSLLIHQSLLASKSFFLFLDAIIFRKSTRFFFFQKLANSSIIMCFQKLLSFSWYYHFSKKDKLLFSKASFKFQQFLSKVTFKPEAFFGSQAKNAEEVSIFFWDKSKAF